MAEEKLYRHVVLFKFAESASKEKVAEIEKAFGALSRKIDSIVGYEWGTNVSPEGLDKGFTHCFLVSFKDKAGLEVYLPHPAHKEFVSLLKPHLEDVLVIDFTGND